MPDLPIQAFREEIAKLPGGNEFLRQWDLIYNVLGTAVALPQAVLAVSQVVVNFYETFLNLLKLLKLLKK
ncbi:hypothetical protein BBI01_04960 [Chryseobacterium artocarpi]|uniref:Uncharacterized protein n=1 Tax=Chryseobacterium artocarpi TaxID=1414727 RepID=A0A1B8ZWU0_9FLAO|nr:hypothetical protein BBI01_04960 [Chryseobacterium artocarpi]